ncbi:ABC transporter ATP-binding protein [Dyadobacter subterraneus]|uniref:ABC transporter ATP-binding protein n=1 Tax=Dyadobacter subterraneus TaxID=2773304 RepID=A0ABR9WQP2_9BACT|nr:ABC transporter ATP-binding protein [Dyadobacter subterraneus]MBE9466414.1 ABC transporter ATP-binding protein [Dyadobacter subterraneus]
MNDTPLLSARNLTIGYKTGKREPRIVSEALNLDLWPGQLVCLLGPNGAGKSTLMRTLSGLQPALSGEIIIDNESLVNLKPVDLAQKLSLVLTERIEAGNLTVRELVALGRTPYTGWLGTLSEIDKKKIDWSMDATDTKRYGERRMNELSDGERQKVMLARALAQDTKLILLDEPTAHLDLPNRVEMMRLLHNLARQTNKAILLSTHELDLALQAADKLWLMHPDGKLVSGVPEDLVLNGSFEAAFIKNGFHFDRNTGTFTIHKEASSTPIYLRGKSNLVFWTKRALQREDFVVSDDPDLLHKIEVMEGEENPVWIFSDGLITKKYLNISELLADLQHIKKIK